MASTESGKWLQDALIDLCSKVESGLHLDYDLITGLVSYCELAAPEDAKEYLTNIVGHELSQGIIAEYLQRRSSKRNLYIDMIPKEDMQAYMKPPAEDLWSAGNRKAAKRSNERNSVAVQQEPKPPTEISEAKVVAKGKGNAARKKKGGKVISLAEAAKGSIVLQSGQPCDCQARRHKLIANCLSCGKIICEQTGEGPCSFCGALVLREGSNYAGLGEVAFPVSEGEAAAEEFKNRLVDYDRNAAERTVVIDDQSDYYDEGNAWISEEEKQLLRKKQEEIEEADRARRNKLVVTLDLVGRKVVMTEQEAAEMETKSSILRPTFDSQDKSCNRIKANPNIRDLPVFVDTRESGRAKRSQPYNNGKMPVKSQIGVCFEITGRVQHDDPLVETFSSGGYTAETPVEGPWKAPKVSTQFCNPEGEDNECFS